jgi:hypothetical protein
MGAEKGPNCEQYNIPESQRRKPGEPVFSWDNELVCDQVQSKGFLNGFLKAGSAGLVNSEDGEEFVRFSDNRRDELEFDPSAGISEAASVVAVTSAQTATHPEEAAKGFFGSLQDLIESAKEDILPKFDCYNKQIQWAATCKYLASGLGQGAAWFLQYGLVSKAVSAAKSFIKGGKVAAESAAAVTAESAVNQTGGRAATSQVVQKIKDKRNAFRPQVRRAAKKDLKSDKRQLKMRKPVPKVGARAVEAGTAAAVSP